MGLDMYLHKVKREEIAYWRKANAIHKWFADHIAHIDEEIENCKPYYVEKEDLVKLKKDCQEVLASSELVWKETDVREYDYDKREYVTTKKMMHVLDDTTVAEELLPTQSGFFFGTTLYGEEYVEDLKWTVEQIDKILETVDFDEYSIEYHAWW